MKTEKPAVKVRRKYKQKFGLNALTRVRKYFPNVERVRDSKRSIIIRVKPEDSKTGKKKDPGACALANACVREQIADQAIIGLGYSYLIKDNVATRYQTSHGVGREIVSFDRHQDFQPGNDYRLQAVTKSQRLGHKPQQQGSGPHKTKRPGPIAVHHTANVRVLRKP